MQSTIKSIRGKSRLAMVIAAMSAPALIRARTLDHQTFDSLGTRAINQRGDHQGQRLEFNFRTHDNRTVDSTGAFLVGELERLDPELHMPLAAVTWSRDIDVREDVSLADELSSFTLTSFGSAGSTGSGNGIRNGKAWIGKNTNQIGGVSIDMAKVANPLTPWAQELKYTILELESAAKLGRPIDTQKFEALKLKHQMDIDEQVYVGDAAINVTGLFNNTLVTNVANVANGALASPLWVNKTPAEILKDVNEILLSTWAASGWAVIPTEIRIPPAQFGYISTQIVSTAGSVSILRYLLENNILITSGKGTINIQPAKWLVGAGSGGTLGTAGTVDRMVAYTKARNYVRFPMTMLQRTPVQYDAIYHKSSYYCRLGVTEVVYPETFAYRDGL